MLADVKSKRPDLRRTNGPMCANWLAFLLAIAVGLIIAGVLLIVWSWRG